MQFLFSYRIIYESRTQATDSQASGQTTMVNDDDDESSIFANLGAEVAPAQTTQSEFSSYWDENVAPKSVNIFALLSIALLTSFIAGQAVRLVENQYHSVPCFIHHG